MSPDREIKSLKIIERILPGRISTRCITSWKEEHGYICAECETFSPFFYGKCQCEDWNTVLDRMEDNILQHSKGRKSDDTRNT